MSKWFFYRVQIIMGLLMSCEDIEISSHYEKPSYSDGQVATSPRSHQRKPPEIWRKIS
jgi:hypothetical protein